MSPLHQFALGVGGSLMFELARMFFAYEEDGTLPPKYKEQIFWLLRSGIALCAGFLVLLLEPASQIGAVSIGAAAPSILLSLGRGIVKQEELAKQSKKTPK
ncbi:MAG TPA: hypothetical protein VEQ60_09085 [Longimicrobium sp.]|nr:hypothetical protein [Longimicrobium sp.]